MITLLETVEATEKATSLVKGLMDGEVNQVIKELTTLCIEAGKSIILAAIIYMVGKFAINLINKLTKQMLERRKVDPTIQSFLKSFVNILLTILLVITVVSALGVNTTSFAALLASMGVAAGMALSGNLQNLAGGIIILLFKPFKVGDYIEAQGVQGTVEEIQIIHTLILTVDNKKIYLPNGALSSSSVTNYSKKETRRVDFVVSVEYGTKSEDVEKALKELIDADERILKTPEPFIALSKLADSSVDFTLRVWVESANYWGVFFDMNRNIYESFNQKGIKFPFPQMVIHQV